MMPVSILPCFVAICLPSQVGERSGQAHASDNSTGYPQSHGLHLRRCLVWRCATIDVLRGGEVMLNAYIFIETAVGKSPKIVGLLRAVQEVETVDRVIGPSDVIARVSVIDMKALGGLLNDRIRCLPGVLKTTTCVVLTRLPK